QVVFFREIVQLQAPGKDELVARDLLFDIFLHIVLVVDIAENLLEHIFHRNDARRSAELVDHPGDALALLREAVHQVYRAHRLRHCRDRMQHLPDGLRPAVQVQVVEVAEDVVDRPVVDNDLRQLRFDELLPHIRDRGADINRLDLIARDHAHADADIHEVERILKPLRIEVVALVLVPVPVQALLHEVLQVHPVEYGLMLPYADIEQVLKNEFGHRDEQLRQGKQEVIHYQHRQREYGKHLLRLRAKDGFRQEFGEYENDDRRDQGIDDQPCVLVRGGD